MRARGNEEQAVDCLNYVGLNCFEIVWLTANTTDMTASTHHRTIKGRTPLIGDPIDF